MINYRLPVAFFNYWLSIYWHSSSCIAISGLSFVSIVFTHSHRQTNILTDDSVHLFNVYPAFDWPSLLLSPSPRPKPCPGATAVTDGEGERCELNVTRWLTASMDQRHSKTTAMWADFLAFSCNLALLGLHSIRRYMYLTYKLTSFECRPVSVLTQPK